MNASKKLNKEVKMKEVVGTNGNFEFLVISKILESADLNHNLIWKICFQTKFAQFTEILTTFYFEMITKG